MGSKSETVAGDGDGKEAVVLLTESVGQEQVTKAGTGKEMEVGHPTIG